MAPRDHAAVVATALFQITAVSSIAEAERRVLVENLIRDELAAARREGMADRNDPDA